MILEGSKEDNNEFNSNISRIKRQEQNRAAAVKIENIWITVQVLAANGQHNFAACPQGSFA
jgi:hypothetical protein